MITLLCLTVQSLPLFQGLLKHINIQTSISCSLTPFCMANCVSPVVFRECAKQKINIYRFYVHENGKAWSTGIAASSFTPFILFTPLCTVATQRAEGVWADLRDHLLCSIYSVQPGGYMRSLCVDCYHKYIGTCLPWYFL